MSTPPTPAKTASKTPASSPRNRPRPGRSRDGRCTSSPAGRASRSSDPARPCTPRSSPPRETAATTLSVASSIIPTSVSDRPTPLQPVVRAGVRLHHLPKTRPPLTTAAVLLPPTLPLPTTPRPAATRAASAPPPSPVVLRQLLRRQRRTETHVLLAVHAAGRQRGSCSSTRRFDGRPRSRCTSARSPSLTQPTLNPTNLPHAIAPAAALPPTCVRSPLNTTTSPLKRLAHADSSRSGLSPSDSVATGHSYLPKTGHYYWPTTHKARLAPLPPVALLLVPDGSERSWRRPQTAQASLAR